ncbi:MAG: hypothetical protein QHC90_22945 [Shinella sp.]|nr:hypothetical protein [Shinella sp.]
MTDQTERHPKGKGRGFLPGGFLVFLLALILAPFAAPESVRNLRAAVSSNAHQADPEHEEAKDRSAPSSALPRPLSAAGGAGANDVWLPSGHGAERRVTAKVKNGLAEGGFAGKAAFLPPDATVYPFETWSHCRYAPRRISPADTSCGTAFRSRAPPSAA